MQRYEKYKDSGIEWLGEVPVHWVMKANKYVFQLGKNQVGKRSSEYDLLSLTLRGIVKRDMENPEGKFPAEFDTYQEVKVNDFVFCLFDVEETPRTVGLSSFDGMITGAYTVMKPLKDIHAPFMYYYYLNADDKKQLKFLYRGLRNTIPKDSFSSLKSIIPPINEQEAIANYLNEKCEKIGIAVNLKEQQIERLKELRQITIHNAVTKGISHFTGKVVRMKNSGIDWIGEIPEHWKVKPLRYLGTTQNGLSKGGEFFGYGTPFVSYSDVYKNEEIPRTVNGLVKIEHEELKQYSVLEGDVFFTRTSETVEEIGLSSVANFTYEKASFAGFLIRFRPTKDTLFPLFSKYYFRSQTHRSYFVGNMNLVIRASLSQELLKGLPVLLPPLSEQEEIASYLEKQTSKIDKAIAQKQKQIIKLKEYKQSLINEVVTGKVRVN